MRIVVTILLAAALVGCEDKAGKNARPADDHKHDHGGGGGHGHVHTAPRGGTLIILGDEAAHIELLLDPATGKLDAYVLDDHADQAVRIAQPEIVLVITPAATTQPAGEPKPIRAALAPVASELSGERAGDTSHYSATVEALRGVARFTGVIDAVEARGSKFSNVAFRFPEGNAHD